MGDLLHETEIRGGSSELRIKLLSSRNNAMSDVCILLLFLKNSVAIGYCVRAMDMELERIKRLTTQLPFMGNVCR